MSCAVLKDCINNDSYGEICTWCNACGRIDKSTMWQARYDMYVRHLKELVSKFDDDYFNSNLQQINIAADVIHLGEKIKECVEHIDFDSTENFEAAKE